MWIASISNFWKCPFICYFDNFICLHMWCWDIHVNLRIYLSFNIIISCSNDNSSGSLRDFLKILMHLIHGTYLCSSLMRAYLVMFHFFLISYGFYYNLNAILSKRRLNVAIITIIYICIPKYNNNMMRNPIIIGFLIILLLYFGIHIYIIVIIATLSLLFDRIAFKL